MCSHPSGLPDHCKLARGDAPAQAPDTRAEGWAVRPRGVRPWDVVAAVSRQARCLGAPTPPLPVQRAAIAHTSRDGAVSRAPMSCALTGTCLRIHSPCPLSAIYSPPLLPFYRSTICNTFLVTEGNKLPDICQSFPPPRPPCSVPRNKPLPSLRPLG